MLDRMKGGRLRCSCRRGFNVALGRNFSLDRQSRWGGGVQDHFICPVYGEGERGGGGYHPVSPPCFWTCMYIYILSIWLSFLDPRVTDKDAAGRVTAEMSAPAGISRPGEPRPTGTFYLEQPTIKSAICPPPPPPNLTSIVSSHLAVLLLFFLSFLSAHWLWVRLDWIPFYDFPGLLTCLLACSLLFLFLLHLHLHLRIFASSYLRIYLREKKGTKKTNPEARNTTGKNGFKNGFTGKLPLLRGQATRAGPGSDGEHQASASRTSPNALDRQKKKG